MYKKSSNGLNNKKQYQIEFTILFINKLTYIQKDLYIIINKVCLYETL